MSLLQIPMSRRKLIKWALAGAASYSHAQTSASKVLQAGPFTVAVPSEWFKTAIVENIPLRSLYSTAAWKKYQGDKRNSLKADYGIRPQHWALRFSAALPKGILFDPKSAGDDETAPQILIHKAAQWDVALTDGVHETISHDLSLQSLRKSMDGMLTKDDHHPSPVLMDASLYFQCLKRRIEFKGGHGVRLVAQWTIEPELMRFKSLHYLFLGMSDDGSCQIIATFPLSLEGLPSDDDKEHLGWSMNRYGELSKSFNRYEAEAKRWVEARVEKINPSLNALDAMMGSLVAPRWTNKPQP